VHLVGFIINKFVTVHGHMNEKKKVRKFRLGAKILTPSLLFLYRT